MTWIFVLAGLLAMQLGDALAPASPCATAAPAPPVYASTTPFLCDTPLCQGLVGAGVGIAGLAAIGGIVGGALAHGHKEGVYTHAPTHPPVHPTYIPTQAPSHPPTNPLTQPTTTRAPIVIVTAPVGIGTTDGLFGTPFAREKDPEGSNWLFPCLLALLALCCGLGILGYCFSSPTKKRTAKLKNETKKKKEVAPAPAAAPAPEVAPLLPRGHWEQPVQLVPAAPGYAMAPPGYVA